VSVGEIVFRCTELSTMRFCVRDGERQSYVCSCAVYMGLGDCVDLCACAHIFSKGWVDG